MKVLNLGAGYHKGVDGIFVWPFGVDLEKDPPEVTTLDMNEDCKPDVVFDLTNIALFAELLPFEDAAFDQVHAYSVLEHVISLGCYVEFFLIFTEIHRILKPGGKLVVQCPKPESAWNDPGHTTVISPTMLAFLSQKQYAEQVGKTRMTDYRFLYKADFDILGIVEPAGDTSWIGVLQAVK